MQTTSKESGWEQTYIFINKANCYLQQKHRGTISSFITFVVGLVVGMKLNTIIGSYLILITVPLLIYWIMSENIIRDRIIKNLNTLPNKGSKFYTISTLVLVVISIIVIRVPLWSNIVSFLAPESDSYIIQTTSHNFDGQYCLLVECGIKHPNTYNLNTIVESIGITTNHSWTVILLPIKAG